MKKILIIVCLILSGFSLWANKPSEKYNVIHDFSNDWLVYDQDDKVYTPYLPKNNSLLESYTIQLDLTKYPHAFFVVETGKIEVNIFLNNTLSKVSKGESRYIYDIEALREVSTEKVVNFTFFTTDSPINIKAYIGYPVQNVTKELESKVSKDILRLLPKSTDKYNSAITLVFLVSLIAMTFVSTNYLRVYTKYFSFKDIISTRVKDEMFLVGKPLERPGVFFLILTSMFGSVVILILSNYNVLTLDDSFLFHSGNTLEIYLVNFVKISIFSFLILVLKYFFILFISNIFNLSSIVYIHFFKKMQVNLFVVSIILIGLLIMHSLYIPLPQNLDKYLFISLVVFFVLRGWAIYFTINRDGNTKFVYLISYLCVAEALPTIVGLKFLF